MKQLMIALVLTLCAIPATAQGSKFNMNCDKGEKINKLLNTIAKPSATPPVTINVSGTCHESVLIQDLDRLTLLARPGAAIIGNAKNVNPAVTVAGSSIVTLQGFLIQSGTNGVACSENSTCNLNGLTVEGATGAGVIFARSAGIISACVIQNNGFRGLQVQNGAKVLVNASAIQGNTDAEVAVLSGSELAIVNVTVSQSNGSLEQIRTGNVVTGNTGCGVFLRDLSFARFMDANNVSGNLT
jgi:hypothetical protein